MFLEALFNITMQTAPAAACNTPSGDDMNEIAHLLEKHRKEMAELESEQRKNQRQRENKLKELERLTNEAKALNNQACERELGQYAI